MNALAPGKEFWDADTTARELAQSNYFGAAPAPGAAVPILAGASCHHKALQCTIQLLIWYPEVARGIYFFRCSGAGRRGDFQEPPAVIDIWWPDLLLAHGIAAGQANLSVASVPNSAAVRLQPTYSFHGSAQAGRRPPSAATNPGVRADGRERVAAAGRSDAAKLGGVAQQYQRGHRRHSARAA